MNRSLSLLIAVVGWGGAAGLSPLQGQPSLAFTGIQRGTNLDAVLQMTATPDVVWRVESSTDLAHWQGWRALVSNGATTVVDTAGAYQAARYFRAAPATAEPVVTGDLLSTDGADVVIHPVNHASVVLCWGATTIYVDPVGGASLYADLPRADVILLTHGHSDHFSATTLEAVRQPAAVVLAPQGVYNAMTTALRALTTVLTNGAATNLGTFSVEAVAAYNFTAANHPRGVGNGYVLQLGNRRLYFSGDTEDIPEMRALRDIDVAFLAMNTPYTMTVTRAADAVREFQPRLVYPYHYRNANGTYADLAAFRQQVGTALGIEVRLRAWY